MWKMKNDKVLSEQ